MKFGVFDHMDRAGIETVQAVEGPRGAVVVAVARIVYVPSV